MTLGANLAYTPAKFGLAIVSWADLSTSYASNLFVVWKDLLEDPEGRVYWGIDQAEGNEPFENRGTDDIQAGSVDDCLNAVTQWLDETTGNSIDSYVLVCQNASVSLLKKTLNRLKESSTAEPRPPLQDTQLTQLVNPGKTL